MPAEGKDTKKTAYLIPSWSKNREKRTLERLRISIYSKFKQWRAGYCLFRLPALPGLMKHQQKGKQVNPKGIQKVPVGGAEFNTQKIL
jgi:hypothetical protein